MGRTSKTALGAVIALAGAAFGFLALYQGGITWPVLILVCVLLALGGHLVSHSQMRELAEIGVRLIRAWRGGES